jgi:hypothetical protein
VADEVFEPFSYPLLKDSVGFILTDGIDAKINHTGEKITTKGRRFGYTEEEFLEAYLGKDYARSIDLEADPDNMIFGFHKSLKELVPDKSEFLKLPKVLEQQERLNEMLGARYVDGRTEDPTMGPFLKSFDMEAYMERELQGLEIEHPTDESRSFLKDFGNMLAEV